MRLAVESLDRRTPSDRSGHGVRRCDTRGFEIDCEVTRRRADEEHRIHDPLSAVRSEQGTAIPGQGGWDQGGWETPSRWPTKPNREARRPTYCDAVGPIFRVADDEQAERRTETRKGRRGIRP